MKRAHKFIIGMAGGLSLLFSTTGCGLSQFMNPPTKVVSETGKSKVIVQIVESSFQPQSLRVSVGSDVVWVNNDTVTHSVVSDSGLFHSGDVQPGQRFSFTFKKPGTYRYICGYHPMMQGTLVIGSTSVANQHSSTTMTGMNMDMSASSATKSQYKIEPTGTGTSGETVLPDGNYLLPCITQDGYKVFHLTAEPVWWRVQNRAKPVEAWAFNGSVPGPEVRVNQGDKVKIIVKNGLPEGTSVHWHGLDVPFSEDGEGGLSQPDIRPGQTWTYTFTVHTPPGSYMYHSHPMNDMADQEEMGLFGPFIVEPKGTDWKRNRQGYQDEFTLMLNDSSEFGYTINGKSYPSTPVLPVKLGDKVLVHLINIGNMNHSMHLHGFHFQVIGQDGFPTSNPQWLDTIDVAPGSTYDIAFTADQVGKWLFHCHMLSHVTNGTQMSGLITLFDVKS